MDRKTMRLILIVAGISLLCTGCPEAPDTIAPGSVTGLTAVAGIGKISLSWTDPSDADLDIIEISIDPADLAAKEIEPGIETAELSGLSAGTSYTVSARTCDISSNWSDTVRITATPLAEPVPDVTIPTLTVLNCTDGQAMNTGFIIGTAADNVAVRVVQVSIDGGDYADASGTATWSFRLPSGASIWKLGESHSLSVRSVDTADNVSEIETLDVYKGVNKDFNGDGYTDLLISAPGEQGSGTVQIYLGGFNGLPDESSFTVMESNLKTICSAVTMGDFNGDGYADIALGAYAYNNTGAVFLYYGEDSDTLSSSDLTITNDIEGSYFGRTMGSADVNNDGFTDLAVGAPGNTNGTAESVSVYHGSITGLGSSPAGTLSIPTGDSDFGNALALGDVNKDGYADLAVGADQYSGCGQINIYHGGSAGIFTTAATTITITLVAGNAFGCALAIGDFDGDGYGDLAAGSSGYDGMTTTNSGRVFVYPGSTSGITTTAQTIIDGSADGENLGVALAAGDLNSDGYHDLAVGATGTDTGTVTVYYGVNTSGLPAAPDETLSGETSGDEFGGLLVISGGNLDGYADLLVGAVGYDVPSYPNTGKAYLYNGSASGIGTSADTAWPGNSFYDGRFGSAGDF